MRHHPSSTRTLALLLGACALVRAGSLRAEPSVSEGVDAGPAPAALAPGPSLALAAAKDSAAARGGAQDDRDLEVERAYRSLELRLVRNGDGSFGYTGRGFNARIDALGGLTMKDKFFEARFVLEPQKIDDHTWVTQFFRIRWDLFARIEKAFGNDPYRSERRAFLDQTRELRELLLERNAERALERMLEGLWKQAALSIREKKERLYSLWTECSGDVHGQRARSRIEAFVCEHCPRGSACEYTDEELARFAAKRPNKPRFEPYAAAE